MVFNNGLIVQYGRFVRPSGNITDIHTYTGTFPISFPNKCFAGACTTGTANGVVGMPFGDSNGTTIEWSIKPNHSSTTNQVCFFYCLWYLII